MTSDEQLRRKEDEWRDLNVRADDVIKELREREAGIGHDLEQRIADLHERRENLRTHLSELRAAGGPGADEVRREADEAARALHDALEALDRRRAAAAAPGR